MKHQIDWFKNRIGKAVQQKNISTGKETKITIEDKTHASVLKKIQDELNIYYFDTNMQLTYLAKRLEKGGECLDCKALAESAKGESFGHALLETKTLNPQDWIRGDDYIRLKKAILVVETFKRDYLRLTK